MAVLVIIKKSCTHNTFIITVTNTGENLFHGSPYYHVLRHISIVQNIPVPFRASILEKLRTTTFFPVLFLTFKFFIKSNIHEYN